MNYILQKDYIGDVSAVHELQHKIQAISGEELTFKE